jgi:hypothetical protein
MGSGGIVPPVLTSALIGGEWLVLLRLQTSLHPLNGLHSQYGRYGEEENENRPSSPQPIAIMCEPSLYDSRSRLRRGLLQQCLPLRKCYLLAN